MQIRTLNHPIRLLFILVLLALAACSAGTGTTPAESDLTATPTPESTPTSQSVTPSLYPADSQEPAAGICGQAITSPVNLAISADVPSPRCIQVTPGQALLLSNQTETALHVRLGGYEFDLLPGESANIDAPAGTYLALGVHHVQIDGDGSAPEIWLVDQILGSDAPPEGGETRGMVSGALCFPSEGIPPMTVYLQNIQTGEVQQVGTAQDQQTYALFAPAGQYHAFAYPDGQEIAGGYTAAVTCGLDISCTDHSLLVVEVIPGQERTGVDLCDWYAPEQMPPRPGGANDPAAGPALPPGTAAPRRLPAFTPGAEWGTVSLPELGFQISYPPQAELVRLGSGVEVRLPVPPGTQMEVRSLTIDVRPVVAETCYGGVAWDEVVTIDGVDFQASDPGEWQAAMGGLSFYRSDFAALHDGLCYRVALQIALRDASMANGATALPLPAPAEIDPQALYDILGTMKIE